jgi:AAA+ ATPase superfamily predicted ATPase
MHNNPFTYGNPIRDPTRFHGRGEEIRKIVNRLRSSARESTSVVGERRIGKTSLLKHLAHPLTTQDLGLDPDSFCLVYIDFQGLTDITPSRFWQRVLRKTARKACRKRLQDEIKKLLDMKTYDLFDLEDLFEVVSETGLTVVLLMDEFEYVTQNANFQTDFFGGLRTLAIHQNLVLVTATQHELVELCHSDEIKGSPFFNIFASVVLRPFSSQEAVELVDAYTLDSGLELSQRDKELILAMGGGYPFFVQMAGFQLVETQRKGLPDKETYQETIANYEEQAAPHFSYLWSHSSESEKVTLLATISLNRQKASKTTIPTIENLNRIHARAWLDVPTLTRRGLLLENREAGTYQLFSPSLETWIGREIAANPGEKETQETVKMWTQSQGMDPLDPVQGALPRFKKKYWPIVTSVLRELSFELAGAATFELLVKLLV